jgi:hypothetical protein
MQFRLGRARRRKKKALLKEYWDVVYAYRQKASLPIEWRRRDTVPKEKETP